MPPPDTNEPEDFEAFYLRSFTDVAATLSVTCGDRDLADEAASEAFARALAAWRRVGRMASPTGWVYTVALNEIRHRWRRSRLERRALERSVGRPADVPPPDVVDERLIAAIGALPPRQREAIALRYVADLTEADVAEAMGVRRGTVAATLFAARRTLAAALADHHEPTLQPERSCPQSSASNSARPLGAARRSPQQSAALLTLNEELS